MPRTSGFLFIVTLAATPIGAQVNVLTDNYDSARTNTNLNEGILNRFNVNSTQFGKLFSLPVNGYINAQPLYMQGVAVAGKGTHNVVFVATMHNDVYAFDADQPASALWHVNLGPAASNSTNYNVADLVEIGILSTPVIDPDTQTMYAVALTSESGNYIYKLHALDITTGKEKFGGPSEIQASLPGTYHRDSQNGKIPLIAGRHLQRPGLALSNGVVYIGFGSHDDTDIFHGWLLGYNAANVQEMVSGFLTTPESFGASIWQGGRAPAIDEDGGIYVMTGNGPANGASLWGESFLKLSGSAGKLTVADWFTPDNFAHLNDVDADLGSCGPLLTSTGEVIGGGKEGVVFVLDRNRLGHMQAGNGQILQKFPAVGFGILNMAYWEKPDVSFLYLRANNDSVKMFRQVSGRFATLPFSQSNFVAGLPFDGMAVSANGSAVNTGILWITTTVIAPQNGAGTLHALLASNVNTELWNSEMNPSQDQLGTLAKYTAPTIANGKVYVPTFSNQLAVYGLKVKNKIVADVVNAASGLSGTIAPGEMVVVYGTGLGPQSLAGAQVDNNQRLATSVAGVRVLLNGQAAPLIYVQANQVAAIVPKNLAGAARVSVRVEYQGAVMSAFTLSVGAARPGLFTMNQSGLGQGAILNQDASVNSAANPADRGSIVVLYGTGQGAMDPDWAEDQLASSPLPQLQSPVAVKIGGQEAEVLYAGAAPGYAAVMQINARVPGQIQPGKSVPVVVTIAGSSSQPGVTLAVK